MNTDQIKNHNNKEKPVFSFKKNIGFLLCVIIIALSSFMAYLVQNDFGKIEISIVTLQDEKGNSVQGKLYRPTDATEDKPLPGVLLLHGFNNDKDTEGPAALELAKRGFVALALDELLHGYSEARLSISDALGFMGSSEGALGANASYLYLKNLSFVNGSSLGIIGHSMGGSNAMAVAKSNPDHRAIVVQAFGPANLTDVGPLNNYLLTWPYFEELDSSDFREKYISDNIPMIQYNTGNSSATYDITYGNFADKTAQRYALIRSTHPGGTWNSKGIKETCDWMRQALKGYIANDPYWIDSNEQTYLLKELATLTALLFTIISMMILASILLETKYFMSIVEPKSSKINYEGKEWWKLATINATIGGISFLILPMIGMIALTIIPFFGLITGNGILLWLLINALIGWILFKKWFNKSNISSGPDQLGDKRKGLKLEELGIYGKTEGKEEEKDENSDLISKLKIKDIWIHDKDKKIKLLALSAILFIYMYAITGVFQLLFNIEFRFMWSVFKLFNFNRFIQFIIYIIPTFLFFLINGGIFLFGQARISKQENSVKEQIIWWIKNYFAMMIGLVAVFLIQYMPMFLLGTGPIFSWNGLYGIFLMQTIPQFAVLYFLMTYFYRKTGKVYLGSMMGTLITVWIMAAGSAIWAFP